MLALQPRKPVSAQQPRLLSLRSKPLEIHHHFRFFYSCCSRFGAQVGLSADCPHFIAQLQT
jgi:hypothetical protein